MTLHGENLKMGKDVRGIERGKWACGECEDDEVRWSNLWLLVEEGKVVNGQITGSE